MKTEGVGEKESVTFSFKTIPIEKKVKNKEEIQHINDESLEKYGEKIADLEERLNKKQENPLKYFTDGI